MSVEIAEEYTSLTWPADHRRPKMSIPEPYHIGAFPDDADLRFNELLFLSGFEPWEEEKLRVWKLKLIPRGWFAVTFEGLVVAACAALHENNWIPFTSEISFLVRDPDHRGKGLGRAVFIAAMNQAFLAGYRNILLRTNRPNAISIYREMGFEDAAV